MLLVAVLSLSRMYRCQSLHPAWRCRPAIDLKKTRVNKGSDVHFNVCVPRKRPKRSPTLHMVGWLPKSIMGSEPGDPNTLFSDKINDEEEATVNILAKKKKWRCSVAVLNQIGLLCLGRHPKNRGYLRRPLGRILCVCETPQWSCGSESVTRA